MWTSNFLVYLPSFNPTLYNFRRHFAFKRYAINKHRTPPFIVEKIGAGINFVGLLLILSVLIFGFVFYFYLGLIFVAVGIVGLKIFRCCTTLDFGVYYK